jgi:hypothetical protein
MLFELASWERRQQIFVEEKFAKASYGYEFCGKQHVQNRKTIT